MNMELVLQAHTRWLNTDGKSGRRADFSGQTLDHDFSGADLRDAIFIGANIEHADFADANLEGANLQGVHGQHADLGGAYLSDADLTGAKLDGANLEGAILLRATLARAYLNDAVLAGANLEEADLTAATLRGAILISARVKDAILTRAMAMGAKCSECDLEEAKDLTGADFEGATLTEKSEAALNRRGSIYPTHPPQQVEQPRVIQVTRLVGDFALTPAGQPNMTRQQYEGKLAEHRHDACKLARALAQQAAQVRGFDTGGGDRDEAMSLLTLAFHGLRAEHHAGRLKGVRPFDPFTFWATSARLSGGTAQAAAFILWLWDSRGPWTLDDAEREEERRDATRDGEPDPYPPDAPTALRFDFDAAMRSMDRVHVAALGAWMNDRWWP